MKKFIIRLCSIFSLTTLCYILFVGGIILYFNAPNFFHKTDKRFIIESGMTLREVVYKLHEEKIVKRPEVFLYVGQLIKGIDPKVRYGEYFFQKNISYYKILHNMIRGNIFFRKITIAEGLSNHSAIQEINNSHGLIGEIPENIQEGDLLPETYFYSYNDTKTSIIRRMQDQMDKTINDLWGKRSDNLPIRTKQQAIILASIVEKETGSDNERAKIASVFINRLNKGMKLQSDPTIIYSYAKGNRDLEREIRISDIRNKSIFNTYNIYGLPPTPICNPGRASIEAVLNPIKTDYLYFVANGKNGHFFAKNLRDHNQNVSHYRKLLRDQKQKQRELENQRKPEMKNEKLSADS